MMEAGRHDGTKKRIPEDEKRKDISVYAPQLTGLSVVTFMKDQAQEISGETYLRWCDILQKHMEIETIKI